VPDLKTAPGIHVITAADNESDSDSSYQSQGTLADCKSPASSKPKKGKKQAKFKRQVSFRGKPEPESAQLKQPNQGLTTKKQDSVTSSTLAQNISK
jgi:hypothetical protein